MNRAIRRSMILVAAGVAACNGDPTGDLRNGIDHLVAAPTALFLSPGGSTNVIVEAVDEQGNRQGASFTIGSVSPGINVVEDLGFNPIYDKDGNLVPRSSPTRVRYVVTPDAPSGSTGFVIRAGGKELTIPVRLVPDHVDAAYSNATPAPGDTVTLTTQAPFLFRANATVTTGGNRALIVSQTASEIRFIPIPGGTPGAATVTGVALDYATTLALAIPTVADFTTPSGFSGADALATAPPITIPAAGAHSLFLDVGTMQPVTECDDDNGSLCRAYRIDLATARTFKIDTSWQGTSDLGLYFYDAAGNALGGACDSKGNAAAGQPETCTRTFGPGTIYVTVVDFGPFYDPAEAAPTWIRLDITGM
jgi:hypothetical protein